MTKHRYRRRIRDRFRRTCTCGRRGYCPDAESADVEQNPDGVTAW